MGRSATATGKVAARCRTYRHLVPALIVLALTLALPTSAAAFGTSGNGRTFAVRAVGTSGLGTIVIDSQPSSADVRLDGVDAGLSTPATFTGVTPGAHQVSVTIPGFQAWEETVSVTADATTTVQAALLVALPATVDAEVTVTTTSDVLDGDVSSIAALQADPGPDGVISLREAITAANATAGNKVIRFAPALEDSVITPGQVTGQPLPALTGDDIWIIGDIDGDGAPDVTLDGILGQETPGPLQTGISIWSSGVVVSGFRMVNDSGVALGSPSDWTGSAKTLADDRLLGNSVDGSSGFIAGPLGSVGAGDPVPISNLTWSGLIFAGNQLSGSGISAYPGEGCAHDNHFTDLTIASNTVTDSASGIVLAASDTNTRWQGVPGPTRYADNNTLQGVTIEHNRCREILYAGIHVYTADLGGSDCAISDVVIRDNEISFTAPFGIGIEADAAELSGTVGERACARDSLTHVEVRRNRIHGAIKGIFVCAGGNFTDPDASALAGGAADDVTSDVVVADNEIRDSSGYGIEAAAGMAVQGASPCMDTTLTGLVVSNNLLANATTGGVGIRLAGGMSGQGAPVTGNALTGASVTGNTVQGFAQGIWVSGGDGTGAVGNTLTGSSSGNSVSATKPWLIAADSGGASGNTVSFAAADLTPTVTSFTPTSGPVGTSVAITGANLTETTAVAFNGTPAAHFSVVNDTHITAKVPAGATTGAIAVTLPGGSGTSATAFKVKPRITTLSPTSGHRRVIVVITGTTFGASRGASYVRFGTTKCGTYLSWSKTRIKCRVPAKATFGWLRVRVTTAAGTSNGKGFTVKR